MARSRKKTLANPALPSSTSDWNMRQILVDRIAEAGGWVNVHTHLDRAYTITPHTLSLANASLQEKWSLVDDLKRQSTVDQMYDRMSFALDQQRQQGVQVVASFIDVDEVIGDKAILAAQKLREKNSDIRLVFINQTLKGVLKPAALKWFVTGAEFADIIGGLPGKDRWFENEHIDMLLQTAKSMDKMVHIHVDQFNTATENETELLADKVIQHGLQGRVAAVHSVSLSAQRIQDRRRIYRKLREARVMMVVCPTAWIDARRSEELSVTHNAIAPVEELIEAGVVTAMGTDNIADIYKPFTDGDMWTELRFLLESCHYYQIDELVKIATINGRKVLGIA